MSNEAPQFQHPNKAKADGYDFEPFFFVEKLTDFARVVAWSPWADQMSGLVYDVTMSFPEQLSVLLKIEAQTGWTRFFGTTSKGMLNRAIQQHLEYIFRQSGIQFCVKRPDTNENFALDEYGILYIYSEREEYQALCKRHGYMPAEHPLLFDREDVEFFRFDDEQERQKRFIEALGLRRVSLAPNSPSNP